MTRFYQRRGKRILDVVVASAALVGFAPVIGSVALATRVALGSPVLFRQRRPGRDGHGFELLKFRTMLDATDRDGNPLPDAARLTRFGRWLRSTSLDELPELINVLRGEMSLVGPRPLLVRYLSRYDARQARRHDVRPGITGLAQVRGRNALSWPERLEYDVCYVEEHGFWLDVRILLETIVVALGRQGVSEPGQATMTEFAGDDTRVPPEAVVH